MVYLAYVRYLVAYAQFRFGQYRKGVYYRVPNDLYAIRPGLWVPFSVFKPHYTQYVALMAAIAKRKANDPLKGQRWLTVSAPQRSAGYKTYLTSESWASARRQNFAKRNTR